MVGERGADGDHATLLRELAGDRRVVGRAAVRQGLGDLAGPVDGMAGGADDRGGVAAHRVEHEPRLVGGVTERARDQPERRGRPIGPPLVASQGLRRGRGVEQDLTQIHRLDPVDEGEMGFREHRDVSPGEALDEVDLPERPAAVEGPGHDPTDQLAQLVHAARTGQRRAAYVIAEVEVGVVDPDRVGQPAGDRPQLLPVARDERDPVADQLHQPVVVEARVAGVEDLDGGVVHRGGRRLEREELQVAGAQPLMHPVSSDSSVSTVQGAG